MFLKYIPRSWATIIPELKFGTSVIHNVVALVVDDPSLSISLGKQGRYQIEGILGYPVLRALGSFTVLDAEIHVVPESEPSSRSSSLYTEELTPLLQVSVERRDLLLIFDTGDASTHSMPGTFGRFRSSLSRRKQRRAAWLELVV